MTGFEENRDEVRKRVNKGNNSIKSSPTPLKSVSPKKPLNKKIDTEIESPKSSKKQLIPHHSTSSFYLVTALSFIVRFFRIHLPAQVVFDEVHFGKFASHYIEQEYYFDVHPPLGKMLFALVGYLAGFDGKFKFEKIGLDYITNNIPYIYMRSVSGVFGSLIPPLCFLIMSEMGFCKSSVLLSCFMLIFENTLVALSRFILLDSFLLFSMTLACYAWIKFYKLRNHPYTLEWWMWLSVTGMALGVSIGIKMIGLFVVLLIGCATVQDLWRLLDWKKGLTNMQVFGHFLARALCLIVLPISIYIASFYAHFNVLVKSGPGDVHMSPEFQSTLIGNKMSGKSYAVYYNKNVTLRSKVGSVYLHSHVDRYPLHHNDKKVSSAGQQVTGYPFSDLNNQWIIIPVNETSSTSKIPIKDGDQVLLKHFMTDSYLLVHDVASPLTMTNMEVTCINFTETRLAEITWKIEVKGGPAEHIRSKRTTFRLFNEKAKVSLNNHNEALPAWGFKQMEINGLKLKDPTSAHWFIEDTPESLSNSTAQDDGGEEVKFKPGFWDKFIELQTTMIKKNSALFDNHPFASTPMSWPFVVRGVSFWQSKELHAQIYFLNNIVIMYLTIAAVSMVFLLIVSDMIFVRRGIDKIGEFVRHKLYMCGGFLLGGWAWFYLPFFTMSRVLFLHHYDAAIIMGCMCVGCVHDFIFRYESETARRLSCFALIGVSVFCFTFFAPLTYGFSTTEEAVKSMQWLPSWDFSYVK